MENILSRSGISEAFEEDRLLWLRIYHANGFLQLILFYLLRILNSAPAGKGN
ncbi:hypothetical protein QUA32_12210 [Microcoleus sp. Pol14D6]|uniref:hypothetical protein n=1 Tax=unclassified Microcoleus TaxID=2642155 RepID=UPI002FCF9067